MAVKSVRIGTVSICGKSSWELIDSLVNRLFQEYLMKVDPCTNLGLSSNSVESYQIGEEVVRRLGSGGNPELLPYGYLVGEAVDIGVNLQSADSNLSVDNLAFESAVPKPVLQRCVGMLNDHNRLILSGPAGTGKTFLANKLAGHLLATSRYGPTQSVNRKCSKKKSKFLKYSKFQKYLIFF